MYRALVNGEIAYRQFNAPVREEHVSLNGTILRHEAIVRVCVREREGHVCARELFKTHLGFTKHGHLEKKKKKETPFATKYNVKFKRG